MVTRLIIGTIGLLFFCLSCTSCLNQGKKPDRADGKTATVQQDATVWPEIPGREKDPVVEKRIAELLSTMSLDRKIGQMVQIEIRSFTPEAMKKYRFGSVLNGGGSWPHEHKHADIAEWVALADTIWNACVEGLENPIPPLWGTDAVHGHNNVAGATLFPHNIGLGAAHDTSLLFRIGQATAMEIAATGLDWNFAPTLAVVRDDRWGRTYESYSEMPDLVASYAEKIITGMQGAFGDANVLATAKHYLGDGGTENGDDRGNNTATEADLSAIHAAGYFAAVKAGVQVVMASYSSWRGMRMHENRYLLTDILKGRLGFDGFVVSDWNAVEQVEGCTKSSCPQAVNAGVDMFMVPFREDWQQFIGNLKDQVASGEVPMARIDDAVARILRVKLRSGLFEKPSPAERKYAGNASVTGSPEHRALAREAVRKSLVLLKNNNRLLPLARTAKVLVAGCGADSIAMQAGGWSLTWQGNDNTNSDFVHATSILNGIRAVAADVTFDQSGELADKEKYDAAIVVIGERPYAEFSGDIEGGLTLEHAETHPEDLAVLEAVRRTGVPVVTVFLSGRPLCVNRELNRSDAFVAAWLPGSEGGGVADVLFRTKDGKVNRDFSGTLSFSWPQRPCQTAVNFNDSEYDPLFPLGYGLTYGGSDTVIGKLPEPVAEGYGCNGVSLSSVTADSMVTVFSGKFDEQHYPWMGGPDNWAGKPGLPDSSIVNLSVHRTGDRKNTPGTAVSLLFKGPAYWGLGGRREQDLSGYYVAGYYVVFDVRLNKPPQGTVAVVIQCTYPCQDRVDITGQLGDMQVGKWEEIRIPLKKFSAADFRKINSMFQVSTSGAVELEVANVRWAR